MGFAADDTVRMEDDYRRTDYFVRLPVGPRPAPWRRVMSRRAMARVA